MILNPQEMVEAERHLIEGGINPESLMDEAGLGIANAVSQFFPQPGTLFVFVGHGSAEVFLSICYLVMKEITHTKKVCFFFFFCIFVIYF